jgi:hypothetical protein
MGTGSPEPSRVDVPQQSVGPQIDSRGHVNASLGSREI